MTTWGAINRLGADVFRDAIGKNLSLEVAYARKEFARKRCLEMMRNGTGILVAINEIRGYYGMKPRGLRYAGLHT